MMGKVEDEPNSRGASTKTRIETKRYNIIVKETGEDSRGASTKTRIETPIGVISAYNVALFKRRIH